MDAVSIEQMNKVRASLGLAPLPVPGNTAGPQFKSKDASSDSEESDHLSTLDKRQAAAGSNWQRLEADKQAQIDRQKRKDAAKKARDTAARFEKLQGKGLGDADSEEELDTRSWLLQQKKRQKKIDKARKLEEELAARERQAEYTAKDLAGVRVGHEAEDFDETTGEQILTLKDTEIGADSEEDELENADLRAKDKLNEKLKLKKRKPDYDPTEQEENKGVLSKYDEEIDGKKRKHFALDGQGTSNEATRRKIEEDGVMKSKGIKISLDILKDDTPASDYLDPSTIKVKKSKKSKKEKKSRNKAIEEDDVFPVPRDNSAKVGSAMDLDNADSQASNKRAYDLDDEDLQTQLAEQRRQVLKKRKKLDAAEVARQMREEMPVDEGNELEDGGLVIDETTEFVANLRRPEDDEDRANQRQRRSASAPAVKQEDEDGDGDVQMQSYAEVGDDEEHKAAIKREATPVELTTTGLEDEETMNGTGMAATVAMLRKRGITAGETEEDLTKKERDRARFLADKQQLIEEYDAKAREQRELDRQSGRFDKMTHRERENHARQQNEAREQNIARLLAEKFNREYKPDVELRYNDEYGREMNRKEAFKHLSHMFHGKGSGKQKTEKRLKKIEDEKKNMAKGLLNVGDEGGMMNVQGREGKRQKTAGVRLQ